MAIPILYWMLECDACRTRFVVRDSYYKSVGVSPDEYVRRPNGSIGPLPGAGYGGPPLEKRYTCARGCTGSLTPVASVLTPNEENMWLHRPHEQVAMTPGQREEWSRLIREAGLGDR